MLKTSNINKISKFLIISLFLISQILNNNNSDYKIKIAIYSHSLNNGGIERNTALFLKYLSKFKIFEL